MTPLQIALSALGGLVLLLLLLLVFGRAKLVLRYQGGPEISLSFLGVKKTILQSKMGKNAKKKRSQSVMQK